MIMASQRAQAQLSCAATALLGSMHSVQLFTRLLQLSDQDAIIIVAGRVWAFFAAHKGGGLLVPCHSALLLLPLCRRYYWGLSMQWTVAGQGEGCCPPGTCLCGARSPYWQPLVWP